MNFLFDAQVLIAMLLGLAALGMEIFALIEAVRHPASAYSAAEKLTKNAWVAITGIAVLIGFIGLQNPLGIGLIAIVAAGVFLADVRPAIRRYTPAKRKGGASGQGPYGSW